MGLEWDARQDFLTTADGWEPIRFCPAEIGPKAAPSEGYSIQGLRRAVSSQEAARSEGRYTATDVVWHLVADALPHVPTPGDRIVDAQGVQYRVLEVSAVKLAGRYRCLTRNLAIGHGLDTLVDIQRAQVVKSSDGVEVLQWTVWRSGIRAKVQPWQRQLRMEGDQLVSRLQLKIYLDESVPLDGHSRIRGPDGTVYRIVAIHQPHRIDALMELDVEAI